MTAGPQTKESADAALGDTDDQVLAFVRTGIDVAGAADDRTAVSVMATDPNLNLAHAALRALNSANTALRAAQQADEAAADANASVSATRAAYEDARASANEAVAAGNRARDSAIAAGASANVAIGKYNEMVARVNARIKQAELDHLQAQQAAFARCLESAGPDKENMAQCLEVYRPAGEQAAIATSNREFCNLMAPQDSDYYKTCVADSFNPLFNNNRAIDMIQSEMTYVNALAKVGAGALGLLVIGLSCAATCSAALTVLGGAEVSMGIGGLFDVWIGEQAISWAAGTTLTTIASSRLLSEVKGVFGRIRVPAALERVALPAKIMDTNLARMVAGAFTCTGNSFAAGTPVRMDGGSSTPIEKVRVGDLVKSAGTGTGPAESRPVTDLIRGTGSKDLVDVTVDVDGDRGTGTGTVTATQHHPFWVPDVGQWRDAGDLRPGGWLKTSSGTWVQITAVRPHTEITTVYNLTVQDFHTYYVGAGGVSLLVHNAEPCKPLALGYKIVKVYDWARRKGYDHFEGSTGWRTEVNDRLRQADAPPIYVLMRGFDRDLSTESNNFGGFLTSAFKGLKLPRPKYTSPAKWDDYSDATQVEMFTMVKAFYDFDNGNGGRQMWKNIKFFDKDEKLLDQFPAVDWWNAVKTYGKGDAKALQELNDAWKKALDQARYDREKAEGTL